MPCSAIWFGTPPFQTDPDDQGLHLHHAPVARLSTLSLSSSSDLPWSNFWPLKKKGKQIHKFQWWQPMVRNWSSTRYTSSLKNTQLTLTVLLKGFSRHQEVIQCRVPCNRQTHVWIQLYWSMLSGLLLVTNRLLSTSHCAMLCLATSLVAASLPAWMSAILN